MIVEIPFWASTLQTSNTRRIYGHALGIHGSRSHEKLAGQILSSSNPASSTNFIISKWYAAIYTSILNSPQLFD